MSKKEKKNNGIVDVELEPLNIPDDEIWTYQIPGLQAPHINKPYSNFTLKKTVFIVTIVIAILLSMYFSIRAVKKDTFEYASLSDGTYEFVKFSNTGSITELNVDHVSSITYDENAPEDSANFTINEDESKPITAIHEYAFNCDEKLKVIKIGPDVSSIDGKSFYTCNALERIIVDENNKNYCDIDGVLYTKDLKELICYPINHDQYLRDKYGYEEELWQDSKGYDQKYIDEIQTYVVPSSVEKIGKLCFNYANLVNVYLPEGLKTIETLGFFRSTTLSGIYSYTCEKENKETHFESLDAFSNVYSSLPKGLEYIGSDAFSYDQALNYIFIPSSVTFIGHHAFWETAYKNDGNICGVSEINVESDENTFHKDVHLGDQWRSQVDSGLFRKSVSVNYTAQRAEK